MKIDCAHDSLVDVDKLLLIQNPKNNNKHSKEQIERLAKIIDFQGQRHPIVVSNRSGFITKGHGRLMAIHKLGWKQAAVDYQDYISEAQEYADMTADNEIARWAEFDSEKFLNDIKDIDLGDIELLGLKEIPEILNEKEGLTDPDDVPEVAQNIHNVQLGQMWKLGEHRLMCGDSTDQATVEKLMNGEKVDMVFTDPPYGMSLDTDYSKIKGSSRAKIKGGGKIYAPVAGDGDDFTPDLINIIFASFPDVHEVFIWGADYFSELIPDRKDGSWIVWDKRGSEEADKIIGATFELCWSKQKHKRDIARIKWIGAFGDAEARERIHPTQKPTKLIEWFFEKWGSSGDLVVDFYGGSGSTLIACEKTNRKCFMMELDPHYCSVIIERWQNFTGKKAELLNG